MVRIIMKLVDTKRESSEAHLKYGNMEICHLVLELWTYDD